MNYSNNTSNSNNGSSHADEELSNDNSSLTDIALAWQQVINAYKVHWKKVSALAKNDFQLSLKAMLVCAACFILMLGIGLIAWAGLLVVITYLLIVLGLHWLLAAFITISLNFLVFFIIQKIYLKAMQSIGMKTTRSSLFASFQKDKQ